MGVKKVLVLGRSISLQEEMEVSDVEGKLASVLRDIAPEIAKEVERVPVRARIEGATLIVYRIDATFG